MEFSDFLEQTTQGEETGMTDSPQTHERIRVLVETAERSFRGWVYKPIKDSTYRLSDHLNSYDKAFLSLADVVIQDRGQAYRAGDRRDFVAVAVSSVTYITPLRDDEP
jgi:hypothetical protein